jgi:hypothetical protein
LQEKNQKKIGRYKKGVFRRAFFFPFSLSYKEKNEKKGQAQPNRLAK